jgi:hypothetical protein
MKINTNQMCNEFELHPTYVDVPGEGIMPAVILHFKSIHNTPIEPIVFVSDRDGMFKLQALMTKAATEARRIAKQTEAEIKAERAARASTPEEQANVG